MCVVYRVRKSKGQQAQAVLKYTLLPGIIPRLREFATSGFGNLAYLMALIYYGVRLLPANHPYLNTGNIGRYGMRHVIAAAAHNLVLKRENLDQLVVFIALLLGFVIFILQFIFLLTAIVFKPAFAVGFGGIFGTPDPTYDIAFMLMDRVFGVPGMFNSCVAMGGGCGSTYSPTFTQFPTPFQVGLHALFNFYNLAILLIGVMVFLYYVVIVVGETAQTGTPFGRRFNHIWAPIRLVVALGLLVPLSHGLNASQYITLYAAKLGSGLATNGWLTYNNTLGTVNFLGLSVGSNGESPLLAKPKTPEVDPIVEYMTIVRTCKFGYEAMYSAAATGGTAMLIKPYLVKNPDTVLEATAPGSPPWDEARKFYDNKDIRIRFGELNKEKYPSATAGVEPICGDLVVPIKDVSEDGPKKAQEGYYNLILYLWQSPDIEKYAHAAACLHLVPKPSGCDGITSLPDAAEKTETVRKAYDYINPYVEGAYEDMQANISFNISDDVLARGWGGAGIWYNKIAEWNGSLFSAAKTIPTPTNMPLVMGKVQEANRNSDKNVGAEDIYRPKPGGDMPVYYEFRDEEKIASMLSDVYNDVVTTKATSEVETTSIGNAFMDIMNFMFGFDGLFDIRKNDNVNPMAQLTAMGKSIIDAAIRNLMVSLFFSAGGGLAGAGNAHLGGAVGAVASMFASMTTIGLSIGFILYYVLPFLPFIYFFFAVSAWVKTIFEAMVGAPLWALAHFRIDGNGLPGEAAMNGYYLIFEIFVRPILTVFGLIVGVVAFSAMARTMNAIFGLVTTNLTGFDCGTSCDDTITLIADLSFKRSIIDEFFFTVVYTILIYMMALSCFKMINLVPNGILKWMGASVKTFADDPSMRDPATSLVQYAAISGADMSGKIVSTLNDGARAGGGAVGGVIDAAVGGLTKRNTHTPSGTP